MFSSLSSPMAPPLFSKFHFQFNANLLCGQVISHASTQPSKMHWNNFLELVNDFDLLFHPEIIGHLWIASSSTIQAKMIYQINFPQNKGRWNLMKSYISREDASIIHCTNFLRASKGAIIAALMYRILSEFS